MSDIKVNKSSIDSTVSSLDSAITDLKSKIDSLSSSLESVPAHTTFTDIKSKASSIVNSLDNISTDYDTVNQIIENYVETLKKIDSEELDDANVPEVDESSYNSTDLGDNLNLGENSDDTSYNADNAPISDGDKVVYSVGEQKYSVKSGDTLSSIASKYGCTVDELVKYNNISNPNVISVGQEIKIPNSNNNTSNTSTTVVSNDSTSYTTTSNSSNNTSGNNGGNSGNNTTPKGNYDDNAVVQTKSEVGDGTRFDLPSGLGSTFTYMGWQCITSPSSAQYKLREDAGMNFNSDGIGIINGRYVIACTTTYGKVGDYLDVVQSDGTVIPCIIGDIKSSGDSGCNKWGHNNGQNVIEFVVDKNTWYSSSKGGSASSMHANPGSSSFMPELGGKTITSIVNVGSYYS